MQRLKKSLFLYYDEFMRKQNIATQKLQVIQNSFLQIINLHVYAINKDM